MKHPIEMYKEYCLLEERVSNSEFDLQFDFPDEDIEIEDTSLLEADRPLHFLFFKLLDANYKEIDISQIREVNFNNSYYLDCLMTEFTFEVYFWTHDVFVENGQLKRRREVQKEGIGEWSRELFSDSKLIGEIMRKLEIQLGEK